VTFLNPSYFAPVRAMRVAAFDHTFTPITLTKVRQPNGEYVTVSQEGTPFQGKLVAAGVKAAEEAAARGFKADWIGKVPLDQAVSEGQRFRVTGIRGNTEWTETVENTGDLKGDRINRRFAAVDVELVP
jgi:hypothetical protein